MIDISGFTTIKIKDESSRVPLLCVTSSTVSFGIGALEALNKPAYARLVVDELGKRIFLFGSDSSDKDSFAFVKKATDRYVRLKSQYLHRVCDQLSGYSPDRYPYRVDGKIDTLANGNPVIVFAMENARKTGVKS